MNNEFSITMWLEKFLRQLAKPTPVGYGETLTRDVITELLELLLQRNFNEKNAMIAWDNVFLKPRTFGKKNFHISDLFAEAKTISFDTHTLIISKLQKELYETKKELNIATANTKQANTTLPDENLQNMIELRREMFEHQETIARLNKTIDRITKENVVQFRKLSNMLHYLKTNGMLEDFVNNANTRPANLEIPATYEQEE